MPEQKKYTVSVKLDIEAVDESQTVVIARDIIETLEASVFDVEEIIKE